MLAQKLLIASAVIGLAAAQTSVCSTSTATITSQADVAQYTDCTTFTGDILISADATEPIDISGPDQIKGSLIVENANQLTSLSSSTIATITDSMTLTNLTILSTLSFTLLTSVGSIAWTTLPALPSLTFSSTVSSASSVLITDTFLSSLDGINLATVDTLNINNNVRLTTFSTQVANITSLVNIEANGASLAVEFPNLIWAANATFRNVSTLSLPSLAVVNGSLGFYGNYFTQIYTPNLTEVSSGTLSIVDNAELTNISMTSLKTIGGGDVIQNNTALSAISFPALSYVGGAISFLGNFSTPSLPALTDVKGGMTVVSTTSITCTTLDAYCSSGTIQGKCSCVSDSSSATTSGTSTASGSSASSTSTKGAAVQVGVSAQSLLGLSFIGGLFQLLV